MTVSRVSRFSSATVADGTSVKSIVNVGVLATMLQSDPYLDTTAEISRADVLYTHQDGRQNKVITHRAPSFVGQTSWSSVTRDGTWQKTQVKVFDSNGAVAVISRDRFGSGDDITHTAGVRRPLLFLDLQAPNCDDLCQSISVSLVGHGIF